MCRDVDLFGEVVVTHADVEKWLRCVPHFENDARPQVINDYIRGYDVVNKIKREKLTGAFYSLNDGYFHDKQNLSYKVKIAFKPKLSHIKIITYGDLLRLEKLDRIGKHKAKTRAQFTPNNDLKYAA